MVAIVDTSYANYLRMCVSCMVSIDIQCTNSEWNWMPMEEKMKQISHLQNMIEARDEPDSGVVAW